MRKEDYVKMVSEQIRCRKARGMIEKELSDHIEDQAENYRKEGMGEEDAMSRAVQEMGDPVETGVELDRVHRPKMEWRMILLIAFLSVSGLIIQYLLTLQTGGERSFSSFLGQCICTAAGFLGMMAVCCMDYSRIGKHAKLLTVLLLFLAFGTLTMGMEINGARRYLKMVFGIPVDIAPCMFLLIPLYGGILYAHKGKGGRGFMKNILWMFPPVVCSWMLSSFSTSLILYGTMLIMLTAGAVKGWYGRNGKKLAAGMWAASILLPAFRMAALLTGEADYRAERIRVWLVAGSGKNGAGYVTCMIREFLGSAQWIGTGRGDGDAALLPGLESGYFVTYIIVCYGILAAVVLLSFLAFLLMRCIRASIRQKNQLGMMMGFGCSLVFLIQVILHVCVNLTLLPYTGVYLPLYSSGGTATVVSFLLFGVILSIYRYQSVLPQEPQVETFEIKIIRN